MGFVMEFKRPVFHAGGMALCEATPVNTTDILRQKVFSVCTIRGLCSPKEICWRKRQQSQTRFSQDSPSLPQPYIFKPHALRSERERLIWVMVPWLWCHCHCHRLAGGWLICLFQVSSNITNLWHQWTCSVTRAASMLISSFVPGWNPVFWFGETDKDIWSLTWILQRPLSKLPFWALVENCMKKKKYLLAEPWVMVLGDHCILQRNVWRHFLFLRRAGFLTRLTFGRHRHCCFSTDAPCLYSEHLLFSSVLPNREKVLQSLMIMLLHMSARPRRWLAPSFSFPVLARRKRDLHNPHGPAGEERTGLQRAEAGRERVQRTYQGRQGGYDAFLPLCSRGSAWLENAE